MFTVYRDYYIGDFETTVFEGQDHTEVWASAIVKLNTEDVIIHHTIDDTFSYLKSLKKNVCIYYHNLKFDGQFWLSFLLTKTNLKQALYRVSDKPEDFDFQSNEDMPNNSFKYSISNSGQWYSITIKVHNVFIEIRDSLKLLPFTVKKIGKDFGTKHKKLEMEYEGFRYAGCKITDEEKKYIANDVLVVKEAMEIMMKEGHKKTTIGSCCLAEFRRSDFVYNVCPIKTPKEAFPMMFPDLKEMSLDKEKYGAENVDEYVRKSYHGGWCYLVPEKAQKIKHRGTTADVNSLYPSMMSSESGNKYPYGRPVFWSKNSANLTKDFIPNIIAENPDEYYYFIRIRTRFYIKENMLPCIQIKQNFLYPPREWLKSSDVYDKNTNKYYRFIRRGEERIPTTVTLTLTETDFALIKEHYTLEDFEVLDGCFFNASVGMFDPYINKYKNIKLNSTGALRELAKLFLNNLYGKFATSDDSSFKVATLDKDTGIVKYKTYVQHRKKTIYIPVGSAITSYARNFTIRAAQKNYYGTQKRGFIYADTDSIHCDLKPEEIKGIEVHDKNFCCWKLESCWDIGWFVRQKTYIEHVTHENQIHVKKPYYNIKCAGMPDKCKKIFEMSMENKTREQWEQEKSDEWNKLHDLEKECVLQNRKVSDFTLGLKVLGKLMPKTIKGGVILCSTTYEMR